MDGWRPCTRIADDLRDLDRLRSRVYRTGPDTGPTVLLVVSYALGQGWRAALPMAVGVALGDFTAMSLSVLGIGALLMASATSVQAVKWIGAAYLTSSILASSCSARRRHLSAEPKTDASSALRVWGGACLARHQPQPEGHPVLRGLLSSVHRSASRFLASGSRPASDLPRHRVRECARLRLLRQPRAWTCPQPAVIEGDQQGRRLDADWAGVASVAIRSGH